MFGDTNQFFDADWIYTVLHAIEQESLQQYYEGLHVRLSIQQLIQHDMC